MTSKVEPPGPEDAESDEFHEVQKRRFGDSHSSMFPWMEMIET